MKIIQLLIYLASFFEFDTRYSLYNSVDQQVSSLTFDCLHAYLINDRQEDYEPFMRTYHLIPYCRRPDMDEEQDKFSDKNVEKMITFADLKKQKVTSEQLLSWSATMDVAEQYESDSENSHEMFYNCSSPWFGSMCQYKFEFDTTNNSFTDIVRTVFENRFFTTYNGTVITCYPFLPHCYGNLSIVCLDWREICDGKAQCLAGEDEEMCNELEINECTDDEYRCHFGGQCIPLAFVLDGKTSMDCLDGSDESEGTGNLKASKIKPPCVTNPTFDCEERTCRLGYSFSCGDGQCSRDSTVHAIHSNCANRRDQLMNHAILSSLDLILNINCRQLVFCLFKHFFNTINECNIVYEHFRNISSNELLDKHCSSKWLVLPVAPIIYSFFQFVYMTNRSFTEFMNMSAPDLICFDPQKCPRLLSYAIQTEMKTNLACVRIVDMISENRFDAFRFWETHLKTISEHCFKIGTKRSCSHLSLFHCARSSKCISYHRLVDGLKDCYYNEDESYPACQLNDTQRFVCKSQSNKCLSRVAVGNLVLDCRDGEDEISSAQLIHMTQPPYAAFCNGDEEMPGQNETDETHCESWPCTNPYTRCDKHWHCWNGADELNCPDTECSFNEHKCELYNVTYPNDASCLPITHLFEKYIYNCDKSVWYRDMYFNNETNTNLTGYISWNTTKCLTTNMLCYDHSLLSVAEDDVCSCDSNILHYRLGLVHMMKTEKQLCFFDYYNKHPLNPFLVTSQLGFFPSRTSNESVQNNLLIHPYKHKTMMFNIAQDTYCNRGIRILFGINATRKCLCPPSYFGDRCQWQNQRVSLTLQIAFRSFLSSSVVFQLVVILIDIQGNIEANHEQITYVAARDCSTKFNIYLLYHNRSKNSSANYSVHIDVFDKITLQYYGSWHLSIPFQFLPVNRLAARLFISGVHKVEDCPLSCGNYGGCVRYANKKSLYFCQCNRGYSGSLCNMIHTCNCSNDSLCLASSICVCPLHKFGSRCNLNQSICQLSNNTCKHNGICIPTDDRIDLQGFACLCTDGYTGARCEITSNRIDILIHQSVSTIFVHLITVVKNQVHEKAITFKKISYDKKIVTLYVTQPFHMVFVEFPNGNFYSIIVQETYTRSESIFAEVLTDRRCSPIIDLLNSTLRSYDRLRRIKYYPHLCRKHPNVICFYDEVYMCMCDLDRFANCFEFHFNMTYDCEGFNDCQHGGLCFQNNRSCPSASMCVCQDCYYGTKCQFSTKGFVLSLDPILGYHIKPNVSFTRQPSIIKVSVGIVMVLLISTVISGLLSIITFSTKSSKEVGCGIYLLLSSIISISTISVLTIKFLQLLLSQMALITNRSYFTFNCVIIDGILKVLFTSGEWLNACVATERMLIIIKGVNFNKKRSKQLAKWIIIIVLLSASLTNLHDPINRRLIDDFNMDEQRTWCLVQYSPSLEIYNSFITLFHFIAPLLVNLISAIMIIVLLARNRTNTSDTRSFKQNLRQQIHEHKHLLIAPCVLILFGVPRLIITFRTSCMKTAREPWLYLIGYFLSFVPTTLIFIIFILPSKKYKEQFYINMQKTLRRCHMIT
jgi:hypothetical protein